MSVRMPKTCLIAETDPFIARLLERFAEASRLVPVHAGVGQDVVRIARQMQPAVIILDARLPGKLRGWEVATVLRQDPELRNIPVIACLWPTESQPQAQLDGAVSYLQKPELHYDDFTAALEQAGLHVPG